MGLNRRQMLAWVAAGTTAALSGCGGGGDAAPTRFVWVLNLHPEFDPADVAFDGMPVALGLPFGEMTPPIQREFGRYSVDLRDEVSGRTLTFDDIIVDGASGPVEVFYRYGVSARLASALPGIVNDFDSTESLVVELDDGSGLVQTATLAFEDSVAQVSNSPYCRLRVSRASDGVLVYDSGLQLRRDSILLYPASALVGLVGVVGVDLGFDRVQAESWPNIL